MKLTSLLLTVITVIVIVLAVMVGYIANDRDLPYLAGVIFKQHPVSLTCETVNDNFVPTRNFDHCFNGDHPNFEFKRVDIQHDEVKLAEHIRQAVENDCPLLMERPFKRHITYDDWLENSHPEDLVNVKYWGQGQDTPRFDQNYTWPYWPLTLPSDFKKPVREIHEIMEKPTDYSAQFGAGIEVFDYFDMVDVKGIFPGAYFPTDLFIRNQPDTFTTTPMHSAFFNSFVYQASGAKSWIFQNHDDAMATASWITFTGTFRNCQHKDTSHFLYNITVKEDEMLYFPPFWAHSVMTIGSDKQNLMFNIRRLPSMYALMRKRPRYGLVTALLFLARMTGFVDVPLASHPDLWTKDLLHTHDDGERTYLIGPRKNFTRKKIIPGIW